MLTDQIVAQVERMLKSGAPNMNGKPMYIGPQQNFKYIRDTIFQVTAQKNGSQIRWGVNVICDPIVLDTVMRKLRAAGFKLGPVSKVPRDRNQTPRSMICVFAKG